MGSKIMFCPECTGVLFVYPEIDISDGREEETGGLFFCGNPSCLAVWSLIDRKLSKDEEWTTYVKEAFKEAKNPKAFLASIRKKLAEV